MLLELLFAFMPKSLACLSLQIVVCKYTEKEQGADPAPWQMSFLLSSVVIKVAYKLNIFT